MSRVFVILLLPLVLILASCGTRHEKPYDVRVQLKPAVLDFGKVRATEQPLVLEFYIENNSARQLTIEKVLPSCGCTLCNLPSGVMIKEGSYT